MREIKREIYKEREEEKKQEGGIKWCEEAEQHEPHPYLGIARCIK